MNPLHIDAKIFHVVVRNTLLKCDSHVSCGCGNIFLFFFGIVYFRLCQAAINRSSEVVLWDAAI